MSSLMGANYDRKAIPGITEWQHLRVQIDGAVCFIDVGSTQPGCAEAAKGGGVHPLKRFVSWVQNVVKQFVRYLLDMLVSKRKEDIVREELFFEASGDWLSDKVGQAATP